MGCESHGNHLSASTLSSWESCQMIVYYTKVMNIRVPPGIALLYGQDFHWTTLEQDQATRIATGKYRTLSELKELFTSKLSATVENSDLDQDQEVADLGGKERTYSAYQRVGLATLDTYNEDRTVLEGREDQGSQNEGSFPSSS